LYKVVPGGPDKDMGGWQASSFSAEQQGTFGVNDEGIVHDQGKHTAALAAVVAGAKTSWPEMVGTDATTARTTLQNEQPWLKQVVVMPVS
jgi:hypothetical protein